MWHWMKWLHETRWEKMGLTGWARTTRLTERDDFVGQDVETVLDTRHEVNNFFYFPGAEKRVTPILHTRHLLPILLRTEYRTSLTVVSTVRTLLATRKSSSQTSVEHLCSCNGKVLHHPKNKTLSQQLLNGLPKHWIHTVSLTFILSNVPTCLTLTISQIHV